MMDEVWPDRQPPTPGYAKLFAELGAGSVAGGISRRADSVPAQADLMNIAGLPSISSAALLVFLVKAGCNRPKRASS